MPMLDLCLHSLPSSQDTPISPGLPTNSVKATSSHLAPLLLPLSPSSLDSRPSGLLLFSNILGRLLPQGIFFCYPSTWNALHLSHCSGVNSSEELRQAILAIATIPSTCSRPSSYFILSTALATIQTTAYFTLLFELFTVSPTRTSAPIVKIYLSLLVTSVSSAPKRTHTVGAQYLLT